MNVIFKNNQMKYMLKDLNLNLNYYHDDNNDKLFEIVDDELYDKIIFDINYDEFDDDEFVDVLRLIDLFKNKFDNHEIEIDIDEIFDNFINRFNHNFIHYLIIYLDIIDDDELIDDDIDDEIIKKNYYLIDQIFFNDLKLLNKSYNESYDEYINNLILFHQYDEYNDLILYLNEIYNVDSSSNIIKYINYDNLIDDDEIVDEFELNIDDPYYVINHNK